MLPVLVVTLALPVIGADVGPARGQDACEPWVGRIVSAQGTVEGRRQGEQRWVRVELDEAYCVGDAIRVRERSRAAIRLRNDSVLRLDENTTLSLPEQEPGRSVIEILRGLVYGLSRVPRALKVRTPFVDGGVEGTEFLVEVGDDRTTITVLQGRVVAANRAGQVTLASGQSATAVEGRAPQASVRVRPRDAVEWALYYPPIIDARSASFARGVSAGWPSLAQRSLEAYLSGNLSEAFAALSGVPADIGDPRFLTYRAALLLTVGRVDAARVDIERALGLDPRSAGALAVRSVIAVAQNDKSEALRLAREAVALDRGSAPAHVALSYAEQAAFDLPGALASAERALAIDEGNGLAWARVAELQLSLGALSPALNASTRAVEVNARLARGWVIRGFAELIQVRIADATRSFEKAVRLDSADPLARLGLGLARIRSGALTAGRREIEVAVALDPGASLSRSYLGKAYFDERRDAPAAEELAAAKELDPRDPTPWLYDAIRKETTNRPVAALGDLQRSIELNDNRAVYRSRLLLDEDLATREASLARVYNDLGFQQLALVEGWRSLNTDPANYSAHRLLADAYAALPRHEIARTSELLQSQLLQPVSLVPVQPQLAFTDLGILSGTGLTQPAFNEYSALFERNRAALLLSGLAGTLNTFGDEAILSGVLDRVSGSAGQFHYETDGFRPNNDLTLDVYDVFGQWTLSNQTSIQAEGRFTRRQEGDLPILFRPDDFLPSFRFRQDSDLGRFGIRHAFSPASIVLASLSYQQQRFRLEDIFPIDPEAGLLVNEEVKTTIDGYAAEVQHLGRWNRVTSVFGGGYLRSDLSETVSDDGVVSNRREIRGTQHANVYEYLQAEVPVLKAALTLGLSLDILRNGPAGDRTQVNPKVGLTWNPVPGTNVRAAVFRTMKRELISNQTLEPTQVAGFNQFFDDGDATDAWRYGVGVDQQVGRRLAIGAEWSKRHLDVPFVQFNLNDGSSFVDQADWSEQFVRAYLYWTPHPWVAARVEYQYEDFERSENFVGLEHLVSLRTHRVPLGVRLYHPSGLGAEVLTTLIDQSGRFGIPDSGDVQSGHDRFVVVDVGLFYRLPRRLGFVSLVVKNLFDEHFRFQDTDVLNTSIARARWVLGRVTLSF